MNVRMVLSEIGKGVAGERKRERKKTRERTEKKKVSQR